MEVDRFGIKFFVEDTVGAVSERPSFFRSLVPVFHTWIQKQVVEGHLLIDIHDYSHIHHGPGILLVGHEGNFSLDMADGRLGLLYYRKQSLVGSPDDRFATILKSTLQGCRLLEDETTLGSRIRFRPGELLIVANDRLHAPNDDNTFAQFRPVISGVLKRVLQPADFKLTHLTGNPKERFAVRVQTGNTADVRTLLAQIPLTGVNETKS